MLKVSRIKPNPKNLRIMKDFKFEKLCKSIKKNSELLRYHDENR